jgi:hypothetical protein
MKYFYCDITIDDYDDDDGSNDRFEDDGTLDEILQSFYDLTEEDGSFLGLENEHEQVMQFMWNSDNDWIVDIPEMDKEGSLQKHSNYDECIILIEKFYGGNTIDVSDFIFQPFENED